MRRTFYVCGVTVLLTAAALAFSISVRAQQNQRPAGQPPPTPRAAAPKELTGYWVSIITEDWRLRMLTPPKSDYPAMPLTAEAKRVADTWDWEKDVAAGEQCRVFGAGGIMRMPIRLHITWQDDTTLKMEIDNGNQVRLFHFDKMAQPSAQSDWQGYSVAEWETLGQGQGLTPPLPARAAELTGGLNVVTTNMKPGYTRRNGVPYSGKAVLREFYDRMELPNGDSWLVDTSLLDDSTYYTIPLYQSTHFKREADGSKFNPRPCSVTPPVGTLSGR